MGARSRVKDFLPDGVVESLRRVRMRILLRTEFAKDRRRYARHALAGESTRGLTGRNLEAQLTKDYHRIEKGLALNAPKRPFGADLLNRMSGHLPAAMATDDGADYVGYAQTARLALDEWNSGGGVRDEISPVWAIGDRGIQDPERFFRTRRSVRDYADADVEQSVLDRAVALAINSPSVCNRQAWHVRFFHGRDGAELLGYQNGNAGFGHAVPVVALVSVDARMFAGAGERNQAWIDGGIFAMSLVWALHAVGLDTCMLNMSVQNTRAEAVRAAYGLDDSELLVMMIAIGHGREGHRVARSPRRTVDEVRKAPRPNDQRSVGWVE